MDLEKVKKNFNWDPSAGDYSKSQVSFERRIQRRKRFRNIFLTVLYVLILISIIIFVLIKYE